MNRKIIAKLWNGELEPYIHIGEGSSELKGLEEQVRCSYEMLEKCLDGESKELLDGYRDSVDEYTALITEQAFCEGFCMGTRLTAEALIEGSK